MNMNTEPVRLPMWASTIAVIAGTLTVALLNGVDWRTATATAVGSLIVLLGGTEVARGGAYAPSTVKAALRASRRTPSPGSPPVDAAKIPSATARRVALRDEKRR